MDAFKITAKGKVLDYRLGSELPLEEVKTYFAKHYEVKRVWSGGRHVLGELEKDGKELFLKLSTTEGIGAITQVEYGWNAAFNGATPRASSAFWVPMNFDCGHYNGNLFYLITDKFNGKALSYGPDERTISSAFADSLSDVIALSEFIQKLPLHDLENNSYIKGEEYQMRFIHKVRSHYEGIPEDTRREYGLEEVFAIVEKGTAQLQKKPRHGDFTPWHLLRLSNGQLGLLDGEHADSEGVEYYDICYFIQRVFSVLENPGLAERILMMLLERGYILSKLKVVLAARGIGGFLDESFKTEPDYHYAKMFKEWVIGF